MHEYHVKIKILSSGIRLRFKTSRCECTTLPHRPTAIRGDSTRSSREASAARRRNVRPRVCSTCTYVRRKRTASQRSVASLLHSRVQINVDLFDWSKSPFTGCVQSDRSLKMCRLTSIQILDVYL